MAKLKDITKYLDKELNIENIKDNSCNGLQVENSGGIKKIGFAVDACLEVFEKAKKANCDLVITHHGLIWNFMKNIVGIEYQKMKFLIENNIATYGAHLPLDLHKKYGNNVQLAKLLGVKVTKGFFEVDGNKIGIIGETNKTLKQIKEILKKNGMPTLTLPFGKKEIKKVAIGSGGSSGGIGEAMEEKVDLMIVGEAAHYVYHHAKESKINVIFNGHYESEIWGVKALMEPLKKKFKVKVEFLDAPTII